MIIDDNRRIKSEGHINFNHNIMMNDEIESIEEIVESDS